MRFPETVKRTSVWYTLGAHQQYNLICVIMWYEQTKGIHNVEIVQNRIWENTLGARCFGREKEKKFEKRFEEECHWLYSRRTHKCSKWSKIRIHSGRAHICQIHKIWYESHSRRTLRLKTSLFFAGGYTWGAYIYLEWSIIPEYTPDAHTFGSHVDYDSKTL